MELREAYDVLEIDPGASEEAVKDARNTLAKVWHPDKHANDPELQKKAQLKLAAVNEAFDAIKRAGYPKAPPAAAPRPKAESSKPPPADPAPRTEPRPPSPAPTPRAKAESSIELVPRRRVRWSVVLLLVAAVGIGAYLAVIKLGSTTSKPAADAAVVAQADAATPPDTAASDPVPTPTPTPTPTPGSNGSNGSDGVGSDGVGSDGNGSSGPTKPPGDKTFGLGATHDDVIAAQGKPTKTTNVVDEDWYYGFSIVTFNKRGKVVGWWDRDDVLNVKLVPTDASVADYAKARGGYAMGAPKDEVIGVQGTPNRISRVGDETWYYGKGSSVTFNATGKLTGYHSINSELSILRE